MLKFLRHALIMLCKILTKFDRIWRRSKWDVTLNNPIISFLQTQWYLDICLTLHTNFPRHKLWLKQFFALFCQPEFDVLAVGRWHSDQ